MHNSTLERLKLTLILYVLFSVVFGGKNNYFSVPMELIYDYTNSIPLLGGYNELAKQYLSSLFIPHDFNINLDEIYHYIINNPRDLIHKYDYGITISGVFTFLFKVVLTPLFLYICLIGSLNLKSVFLAIAFYIVASPAIMLLVSLSLGIADYQIFEVPVGGILGFSGFVIGTCLMPGIIEEKGFAYIHSPLVLLLSSAYIGLSFLYDPINYITITSAVVSGMLFSILRFLLSKTLFPSLQTIFDD